MKARDIFGHIDRLGATVLYYGNSGSVFKLSKNVRLFLYGNETWELKTHNSYDGTFDILNNEVHEAVGMTDQELLGQIEEEILKGKLEAMCLFGV
jgi:hypothetical protein